MRWLVYLNDSEIVVKARNAQTLDIAANNAIDTFL